MNLKHYSSYYACVAMMLIVWLSNYLVQFPINDWLTWGALPYPLSFLVTEVTNSLYGPKTARHVVYIGFVWAIIFSFFFVTPKIALASSLAFLIAQLLDIFIFDQFRRAAWWQAPFWASFFASIIDTVIFWGMAFWGEPVPLLHWMMGDFSVKLVVDVLLLTPFRFMRLFPRPSLQV